ncbi:MAG: HAD-IA family hydrolase [Nitrospinae bacterium]|nr:HAD-IA family hydrolase [Nitrospinota bacterium]
MKRAMEGVLLDFDGTLTKPAFDWPTMKEEMELLDEEVSILDYLPTLSPERAREISDILEKHELKAADIAEANDGSHALIAYLRTRKIPFGVVTNNAERHVLKMVKKINISFEVLITRDIGYWKPDPRPMLAGAEAIGVSPEKCVVIGDGKYDMMAAKAAGMLSVHLTERSSIPSDLTLRSLRDAPALLKQLIDK